MNHIPSYKTPQENFSKSLIPSTGRLLKAISFLLNFLHSLLSPYVAWQRGGDMTSYCSFLEEMNSLHQIGKRSCHFSLHGQGL